MLFRSQADAERPLSVLRVDGGASADDFLMQIQADLLGCRIERPACTETTALGAAALAAQALGWPAPASRTDASAPRMFTPARDEPWRRQQLAGWRRAVARAAGWANPAATPTPAG